MAQTPIDPSLPTDPATKPKPAASQPLGTQPAAPTAAPLSLSGAAQSPTAAPKPATDVAPMAPAQTAVASATQNTADPLAFSAMSNTGVGTQPVTPPTPAGGIGTQPVGPTTPATPAPPTQGFYNDPYTGQANPLYKPPTVNGGFNKTGTMAIPASGAGTSAYGLEWNAGSAPPPNLTPEQYKAWQTANPGNVGYAPDVWKALQAGAGPNAEYQELSKILQSGGTFTPEQEAAWGTINQRLSAPWENINPVASFDANVGTAAPQYLQGGKTVDASGKPVEGGYNADADRLRQLTGGAPITVGGSTPSTPTDPILAQMQPPPSGGATGTPPSTAPGSTSSSARPNAGVGLTPTDPLNALTQQTITPNNTVDRVKLARDAYNSAVTNDLNPQFQADLRDTAAQSFGAGRGVSGMNRTRLGNVQSDFERTKANLENNLITGATNGSIDDMYKNLGIAQQQQGFQAGQEQTAFNQNYSVQQLSDSERQQLFNEAMQQFYAGNIDDPAQFYEQLASQYARPVGGTS